MIRSIARLGDIRREDLRFREADAPGRRHLAASIWLGVLLALMASHLLATEVALGELAPLTGVHAINGGVSIPVP